jgi:hypothetical protein
MSDVGASIKCSDDDWKERVYAELKLAGASYTCHVLGEYERGKEILPPNRLVFIVGSSNHKGDSQ